MKKNIHPNYEKSIVQCACGNNWETKSTIPSIKIELCSACHPFFTGKQKLIDTAGRVDRFKARVEAATKSQDALAAKKIKTEIKTAIRSDQKTDLKKEK